MPQTDINDAPGGHAFEVPENRQTQYMSIDPRVVSSLPNVYVFSVDPTAHIVSKGGLGEFVVPAKPEGARVSAPLVIRGMHPEHMVLGGPVSPVNYIRGMDLAEDIVGVNSSDKGLGRHTSNLEWYGVFITENEKPAEREIAAAEAKRKQYLQRLIADADQKFLSGKQGSIDAAERSAAHELHVKKTWAEKPSAMEQCPACGTSVVPGVAVCPQCKAVLDEAKARHYFPERFAAPVEPTPETPRKRA